MSSDSIVKGIIDDIINTAVKTAEVDEQKTKYLQHFINKHDTIPHEETIITHSLFFSHARKKRVSEW